MKKTVSLFLTFAMLVSVLVIGVSATNNSFEDSLTVQYDFKDNPATKDIDESLTNKAPGFEGKYDAKNSGNVILENGTVKGNGGGIYIPKAEIADLIAGGLYDAQSNTAGKAVEYTMFIRFKIENPDAATEYRLIDARTFGKESTRPICIYIKNNTISFNYGSKVGQSVVKNFKLPATDLDDRYYNIAFTVGKGADSNLDLTVYAAHGIPESEQDFGNPVIKADIGSTVAPINENLWLVWKNGGGKGVSMDEFRIYSKAASASEIASIAKSAELQREVKYVGIQESGVENGKFGVRFVGSVDTLMYSEAGFEISAKTSKGEINLGSKCKKVYKSILESKNGKQSRIEANNGTYLMALSVLEIPVSEGEIVFIVRPYGISDGQKIYSNPYSIKVTPTESSVNVEILPNA